jgi:hypothetical protein
LLRGVVEAFPYAIHTVLTDNGMAFADVPKNRNWTDRAIPESPYLRPRLQTERDRAQAGAALARVQVQPDHLVGLTLGIGLAGSNPQDAPELVAIWNLRRGL